MSVLDGFEVTYRSPDGSLTTASRDGVEWSDAHLPRRLHRCFAQTKGWTNYFTVVWRCPCGAIAMPQGGRATWMEKNNRRKQRQPRESVTMSTDWRTDVL